MKQIFFAVALLAATSAHAADKKYSCAPFSNSDVDAKEWHLPEQFELKVGGEELSLTIDSKVVALKADPWTRKTPNSEKFDRYSAAGVGPVLVAKEAADEPSHFTVKLSYEADSYHGVGAYLGYNCR